MDEWEGLRAQLVRFVKSKFRSRPQIIECADDIVNEAVASTLNSREKCNFGYLSKVCIHGAYRVFKRIDSDSKLQLLWMELLILSTSMMLWMIL